MFSYFSTAPEPQAERSTSIPVTHEPVLVLPTHITVPPIKPLTTSQIETLSQFRVSLPKFLASLEDHAVIKKDKSRLSEREKAWVDDECLLRYLRATKWNLEAAGVRLLTTLSWRRVYKPDEISPEEVEPEAESGKMFFN
ncbi:hypothetical protein HK096_003666, partial [Nowakowskiella sp. JEL0078]